MYQKVAMQLTEERQQHATVIDEFKQVNNHTIYRMTTVSFTIVWNRLLNSLMKKIEANKKI